MRDASLSASKFQDFPEERAAPRRRGQAAAEPAPTPGRAPKKKRSVLARVFAPHRMGMLVLLGIGGLAFVGVPMNALFLQDGHHPAPLFAARAPAPKADFAEAPDASPAAGVATEVASPDAAKAEIAPPVAAKPSKSDSSALKALLAKPEAAPAAAKAEKKRETASRDPIAAMIGPAEAPAKPKALPKTPPQAQAAKPATQKPQAQAPKAQTQAPKPLAQTQAPKTQAQTQASGEDVVSSQRALQRLGYVVKPDGTVSAGTKQAIEKFERDNGLPAKGELSPKIVKLLATKAAARQ